LYTNIDYNYSKKEKTLKALDRFIIRKFNIPNQAVFNTSSYPLSQLETTILGLDAKHIPKGKPIKIKQLSLTEASLNCSILIGFPL
jgi:hypothetical protein